MAGWIPTANDRNLDRTLEVIGHVAGDLGNLHDRRGEEPDAREPSIGPSLGIGHAGLALCFGYLHLAEVRGDWLRLGNECLDIAARDVSSSTLEGGLLGGVAGVGWAKSHLEVRELLGEQSSDGDGIDQALLECVSHSPYYGRFDLWNGLVGIGVYALEGRYMSEPRLRIAQEVAGRLLESCVEIDGGLAWEDRPPRMSPALRNRFPEGVVNLGIAHGTPGVAFLLARLWKLGIESEGIGSVLERVIPWLLGLFEAYGKESGSFPQFIAPGEKVSPSGTGWCYGNPAVAHCLALIGQELSRSDWEDAGLAMARQCAEATLDRPHYGDACLCHGTASSVAIYARLFNHTRDEVFASACNVWLERCLSQRGETGVGGYKYACAETPGRTIWKPCEGLMTGGAGTALALLAVATPVRPNWDRALLLSP